MNHEEAERVLVAAVGSTGGLIQDHIVADGIPGVDACRKCLRAKPAPFQGEHPEAVLR